jgi:putative transposase
MQAEIKDAYWAIFDTEELKTPPGPKLVEIIDSRIDAFAARYQAMDPTAVKCLLADREGPDRRLPAVPRRAP